MAERTGSAGLAAVELAGRRTKIAAFTDEWLRPYKLDRVADGFAIHLQQFRGLLNGEVFLAPNRSN